MRKRLPLLLLPLLLASIAPAGAGAAVTIKVGRDKYRSDKYREQLYPASFRIKGKTGDYRGPVTLELDEFPYDSFSGGAESSLMAETNDRGEYVFPSVGPTRNARVRVRAGEEYSKTIELYVYPGVKAREKELSRDRVRVDFTYRGHPGFAPPDNAFFVYMGRDHERFLRRLGGPFRMKQVGDGQWRFRGVFKEPDSRRAYRYGLAYCTRGLAEAGYGRLWPLDRDCGKRVVYY